MYAAHLIPGRMPIDEHLLGLLFEKAPFNFLIFTLSPSEGEEGPSRLIVLRKAEDSDEFDLEISRLMRRSENERKGFVSFFRENNFRDCLREVKRIFLKKEISVIRVDLTEAARMEEAVGILREINL